MITLTKNVVETFTATSDTRIQNNSNFNIKFQTNEAEEKWGVLRRTDILEVPIGLTVYLKSKVDIKLATIEV